MTSPATPNKRASTPKAGSAALPYTPKESITGDAIVSKRIAFLWSASQTALSSGNLYLSTFYLNALLKFSETEGFDINSETSLCEKCASLMIPGMTCKIRLVPCESLSDQNHSTMQISRIKTTTLAGANAQKPPQVRNAIVYTCKMCRHVMPIAGTSAAALAKSKRRKTALSSSVPSSLASHSSTETPSNSTMQSSGTKAKESDFNAKAKVAKGVEVRDEKQRLLAAMLKSSMQQPAKKTYVVAGSPKKEAAPPPAKTPKKSLFSFLNSL